MNRKPFKMFTERPRHSGFVVLTIDDGETREAWLRHEDYGIMSLMFGLPYRQPGADKPKTAAAFMAASVRVEEQHDRVFHRNETLYF